MKLIQRTEYLNQLIELNKTPDIKVITGIRRCGKSVLMQEYIKYLQNTERDANIIFINLQELENDELREYHKLHEFILSKYAEGIHNVLIIDEIQLCEKFELAINSIHAKQLFDIYITGSNAFLLSSDLATLFTGRTMEIEVFPFSFREYIDYFNRGKDINAAFDDYVRIGGLPGAYIYKSREKQYDYISDVYQTILIQDLTKKYSIRNKNEMLRISSFMMDNVSNLLAPNNICEVLNANGSKISRKTVSKYIDYFVSAFVFYEAKRYDLKGRKYLSSNSKYYLADPGLRYAVQGVRNMDFGRIYENIVYLELLRRGYDVYTGKLYKKEIDFVATRRSEKIYIQVSDDISSAKALERELSPLSSIKDFYPKILIARTKHETYDNEGIRIVDLAGWLAEY